MTQRLISLCISLMAVAAVSAQDLSGILDATRRAEAERQAVTASTLGSIASDMRVQQSAMAGTLAGVASSMRAASASSSAAGGSGAGFYNNGDVNYSTYGTDARADIATNATTANNPFLMGDYSAGGIYAAPAGKKYFNADGGSAGRAPVAGRLTSGFGYRPSFGRMHKGVDLSLNVGDTVRSAFPGKVVLVANDAGGYGRYVKVQHANGLETLYGHLSAPLVVYGQQLRAGQPLGLGGATGNATGPHLHFETRVNGTAVDPANYFEFSGSGGASPRKGGASPINDNGKKKTNRDSQSSPSSKPKAKPRLKTETVASAAGNKDGKQPRTGSYKVRRGDTLAKIARDHGMSVGELCRINKMSPYTPMYTGKVIRLK